MSLPLSRQPIPFIPSEFDLEGAEKRRQELARSIARLRDDGADEAKIRAAEELHKELSERQTRIFSAVESLKAAGREPPTYLIAPATIRERIAFRRAVAAEGARMPRDDELVACLRAGVREAAPDNADELLATIDEWAETPPEDRGPDLIARMEAIEQAMRASYPPYAQLEAARVHWISIAPLVACEMFLRGWQNVDVPFKRVRGKVAEECLEALPEDHLAEIGWKAISLMQPDKAAEKNSGSPSPSPSSPATSTAADTPSSPATSGSC